MASWRGDCRERSNRGDINKSPRPTIRGEAFYVSATAEIYQLPLLAHSCCSERRNMRRLAEELRPLPASGDMGAAFGRAGAHQVALESSQSSQNREHEPPVRGGGVCPCVGRARPLSAICASVFKRSRVERAGGSRRVRSASRWISAQPYYFIIYFQCTNAQPQFRPVAKPLSNSVAGRALRPATANQPARPFCVSTLAVVGSRNYGVLIASQPNSRGGRA